MKRALVLLLVALLLSGCNKKPDGPEVPSLTPTPAPPPPPPPPSVGSVVAHANDTWTYARGTPDALETIVARVTGVTNDTIHMRTVTTFPDNGTHTVVTHLDAATLALRSMLDDSIGAELTFEPPLPIVIPARTHDYNGTLRIPTPFGTIDQPAKAHVDFLGMENVSVPAGQFVTYHYNATLTSKGVRDFEQHIEMWFSPVARQAVLTITDGRTQSLTSYALA